MCDQEDEKKPIEAKEEILETTKGSSDTDKESSPSSKVEKIEPDEQLCRKYIWGTCDKLPSLCKFKHLRDIEIMKKILKFCHDYQNQGCNRPHCSYIHATREEEDIFINYNQTPRVLIDRYSLLEKRIRNNVEPMPNIVGADRKPIPVITLPIKPATVAPQSGPAPHLTNGTTVPRVLPPPPPPPLPPPTTTASQVGKTPPKPDTSHSTPKNPSHLPPHPVNKFQHNVNTASPSGNMTPSINMHRQPMQRLPMQPNPVPRFSAPSIHQMPHLLGGTNSSNYSQINHSCNSVQPQSPLQHIYDASRPPPNLTQPQRLNNMEIQKRPNSEDANLQSPCKIQCINSPDSLSNNRRMEAESTLAERKLCATCIQRKIRIAEYNKEIARIMCLEADRDLLYTHKLEEYNRAKKLLLSLFNTEHRNSVEDYLDGIPEIHTQQTNHQESTNNSTMTNSILYQLLQSLVSVNNRNHSESNNMFDMASFVVPNLSHITRRPLPQASQIPQVQENMSFALQHLIAQRGQTLLQNQMPTNRTSPAVAGSSNMNARSNHNSFDPTSSSQNRSSSNHTTVVSLQTPTATQSDQTYPMYDPNMPPPNMMYFSQNNYTQSNTSSAQNVSQFQNNMGQQIANYGQQSQHLRPASNMQRPPVQQASIAQSQPQGTNTFVQASQSHRPPLPMQQVYDNNQVQFSPGPSYYYPPFQ